jgi:RNA-binding protein
MSAAPTVSAAQKRALKSKAQRLDAVLRIGQAGLSDAFLKSLEEALDLHELVKVRFAEFKSERKSLAPQMAEATGSVLLQVLGNVALLYRPRAAASRGPASQEA